MRRTWYDPYTAHRLELVFDELKAIHELVAEVPCMARKLDGVAEDVAELKQDMNVVKAAVKATSNEVVTLDQRVTRLEAA
jgi:hypothetical protein